MTTAEPNRFEWNAGDSPDAECLLYLLGELDRESRQRFEEKLATNPELSDLLLQQANLITDVAQTRILQSPSVQEVVPSDSQSDELQRWRWIAALVSVAACIALIVQMVRFAGTPETTASRPLGPSFDTAGMLDESVLIAKAWASSHSRLDLEPSDPQSEPFNLDGLDDPHEEESYDLVLEDQPSDIDSTLSWMFVAIASSPDVPSEEGNDG